MKRNLRFVALSMMLSMIFLTAFALSVSGQAPQMAGPLVRLKLKSEVLGEERLILVRTPPGYERNNLRYPVLYMSDGDGHIGHTSATVEFLARNGRIPEMIVVGITNTDRTRDLTPTKSNIIGTSGRPANLPTAGGADNFLKFIETELIPNVEKSYRTQPYRIFAGHSFGGLLALYTMMTKPELFNSYIAVSPSMHWDNQLLNRKAEVFFKDRKEFNRTVYFTLANEGGQMLAGFNRFKEILTKQKPNGFEWGSALMEDEDHGSVVMPSHYQGLRKIYDGWLLTLKQGEDNIARAEEHYKNLSAKYGYQILMPELTMNQLGYQLLQAGKNDQAIAAFKKNVERYPNSANVYDSLGEAYEKSGKPELAKPNYEKAVQLGVENNDPNLNVYKTNMERVSQLSRKSE